MLLGVLLTSLFLLGALAPSASALPENFFGLQASFNYAESEANMEAVAKSGAKYWRLGFNCFDWSQNPIKVWEKWDKEITLAWQHGLTVLATVGGRCNLNGNGEPSVQIPEESEWSYSGSAWNIFLENLVKRYGYGGTFWSGKENKKEIGVWEVMNEPNRAVWGLNGTSADGKYYGRFLKKSAEYIHNAQGTFYSTKVLFGGMLRLNTGGGNKSPEDFMSEAASVGGLTSGLVNGVAIHPYSFFNNQLTEMSEYIFKTFRPALDKSFGTGMDMWITEIGWGVLPEADGSKEGVNKSTPPVTTEWQASLVGSLLQWAKENESKLHLKSLIFYMYRDWIGAGGWTPGKWDSYAGLVREQPAQRYSQQTFRPAWYAFQGGTGAAKWPIAPAAETQAATNIGTTEATLNGFVNPHGLPTGYHFEWAEGGEGFSHWLPAQDTEAGWKEGNVSESAVMTGLKPNTTYHFRIVGTNENNEITFGANLAFTTPQTSPAVVVDSSGVEHIFNRSPEGQLEEWFQIGTRWSKRLLGPKGDVAGSPAAFVATDGTIWVYYRTSNGQLGSWWFKGSESNYEAKGLANTTAGDPAAFQDSEGKRWVYFKTSNGQLGSWWFKGSEWNYEAKGLANTTAGDPAAFQDPEGKRWVYFRTPNGQLGSWWFKGSEWNYEALGLANTTAGDPAAFQDSEGKRWVYFKTSNGQLGSWWFKGSEWNYEAKGLANTTAGDPAAFQDPEGKRWVYFRTPNGQLGSWWFKGSEWNYEAIGSAAAMYGDPAAIVHGGREVFYFDSQKRPLRWSFNGTESTLVALAANMPFATSTKWTTWNTGYSMSFADVNGDGKANIVGRSPSGEVEVGLSTGSAFATSTKWTTWNTAYSVDFADVNGDGKANIVGRGPTGDVQVGLSTGSAFASSTKWITWNTGYSMSFADVNGDGKANIVGRSPSGEVEVGLSTGSAFATSTKWTTWNTAYSVDFADVNGDGKANIVGRGPTGDVQVGLSTGSAFATSTKWTTWNTAYSVDFADVNGDGKADIFGRDSGEDVQVAPSTGSTFSTSSTWTVWSSPYSLDLADASGDGRADAIGRNSAADVQVGLSMK